MLFYLAQNRGRWYMYRAYVSVYFLYILCIYIWFLLLPFGVIKNNKKHLKNVGPIRHCEPPHALILHYHLPGVATVARCHCRMPPAHRCPRQRQRWQQRQHVTEGTAMAPWNGPNNTAPSRVQNSTLSTVHCWHMQCHLDSQGATDLVIDLVMSSHSNRIFLEAIELAIALLDGGNSVIQVC